jgi:hypothetical protein
MHKRRNAETHSLHSCIPAFLHSCILHSAFLRYSWFPVDLFGSALAHGA